MPGFGYEEIMPTIELILRHSRMVPCAAVFALISLAPATHARQSFSDSDSPARPAGLRGSNSNITPEEAVQIIARKIGRSRVKKTHLVFEHDEARDGRTYLVVHGYDLVVDDPKTGEEHTATWGWFFVDQKNGAAFKWDLAEDKLTPF